MDELVERLLAAINESVRLATEAGEEHWSVHHYCGPDYCHCCVIVGSDGLRIYDEGGHGPEDAKHIVRHDPAAVLRRSEADRRIVETYHAMRGTPEIHVDAVSVMATVLRDLAEGYGVEVAGG